MTNVSVRAPRENSSGTVLGSSKERANESERAGRLAQAMQVFQIEIQ